jgi:hypothetical protein
MPFGKTVLLPFSTSAQSLKLQTYWNTILPGSKRYISEDGMAGDNTDVRMPIGDEIWSGGGGFGGGSGMGGRAAAVKSVTMSIDGVFFADGEFMGDDKLGLWESITGEAQARMDVAKIARDGKAHGTAAADILSQIDQVTGPPTGRPPTAGRGLQVKNASVERAQQLLANEIDRMRKSRGDEYTVDTLAAQADTKLPEFRKL